ncbi:MAG TPA: biotin-dependent carboxyltransferase family protein [Rhodanobacteraceae bacterium]|nr:biotin-dependent carboxyltransferase family protein [Rhodanobacteraceae bacterium]
MTFEVIKPGLLTTLQDAGRPGYAHLGVGRSGAFDAPALRIANALCGNLADACGLEFTLRGPTLHFLDDALIAVTGAPLPITIDGSNASMWAPVPVRAGATLELGTMRKGCRSYLAVGGGIDIPKILGSRSVDVNAALGPFDGRPLRTGDQLPVAATKVEIGDTPSVPKWRLDPRPWFDENAARPLRMLPGTHFDNLAEASRNELFSHTFHVAPESNRVGIRLAGPGLEWQAPIEMISEGCVPGLLQLPPSGQPIAFGPECPVSGGYPRIGQIAAVDVPRLAQLRPGDALRFTPCTFDEAVHALHERERALRTLETRIAARLA